VAMFLHRPRSLLAALMAGASLLATAAGALAQTPRFTTSSGTVHDNRTNLTWQQASPQNTTYTQSGGASYCTAMGTGWRLPSIKELQSIVDYTIPSPGPVFNSVFSGSASWYWSATPLAGSTSSAWALNFNAGNTLNDDPATQHYVRCVR